MGDLPSLNGADPPSGCRDRQRPFLGIHGVTVFVRDQDRSLRFYLDQLGFNLAFDAQLQTGDRWVAVAPPDGTTVLALIAPPPDSREFKLIGRPTGVVFLTEDVTAKFEEWRQAGRSVSLYAVRGSTAPDMGSPVWGGVFTRF